MANAAAVQHLQFHPFKRTSGQYLELIIASGGYRVLVARLEKATRVCAETLEDSLHLPYTPYLAGHHPQPDHSPRVYNQRLPRHRGNPDFFSDGWYPHFILFEAIRQ